jgi:hypothetical protein
VIKSLDRDSVGALFCPALVLRSRKLALVFPDLATPTPAVLLRLDKYVVMVVVPLRMVIRVRSIADLRQSRCWALSVAGAVLLDAGRDDHHSKMTRQNALASAHISVQTAGRQSPMPQ